MSRASGPSARERRPPPRPERIGGALRPSSGAEAGYWIETADEQRPVPPRHQVRRGWPILRPLAVKQGRQGGPMPTSPADLAGGAHSKIREARVSANAPRAGGQTVRGAADGRAVAAQRDDQRREAGTSFAPPDSAARVRSGAAFPAGSRPPAWVQRMRARDFPAPSARRPEDAARSLVRPEVLAARAGRAGEG